MDKKEKRVRCLCSTDITPHYARGRREIGEKLSFSMSRHFFFLLLYYYYSVSIFRRYLFICCMLSCLFGISLSITGKFANTRKVFIYLFFIFIFIFILVSYFFILFFYFTSTSFKFAPFFFFFPFSLFCIGRLSSNVQTKNFFECESVLDIFRDLRF